MYSCAHCGEAFSGRKRKYCGPLCKSRAASKKRLPRHVSVGPKIRPSRACAFCGESFFVAPRNPEKIYCDRYCNRQAWLERHGHLLARQEWKAARAARVQERASRIADALARREQERKELALKQEARFSDRLRALSRPCLQCGVSFQKDHAGLKYCSTLCSARAQRSSPNGRARHKAWKIKSRYRQQALTIESFDPLVVFTRDNWTCQICGRKTPVVLRGKHKPNSPELDHVVPLSLGGEHSRANTQCACRQCNLKKSNHRPLGQISLFINGVGGVSPRVLTGF